MKCSYCTEEVYKPGKKHVLTPVTSKDGKRTYCSWACFQADCKHVYYKTVKETPQDVCHHKCVCAECGVTLDPIKLTPMKEERDDDKV